MSFRGLGRRGISVHGNFSSARRRRNSRSHSDHAQSGVVVRRSVRYLGEACETAQKPSISGTFQCKIIPSPSSLENAIALQKFGVGQPVRRKEDDTLVRGKGKYTDDFNLPGQAYAWIVRSSHAHGVIRGIDTIGRQGHARRARRLDRSRSRRRQLRPLHLRPAAEKPRRHAAAADQPHRADDATRCAMSATPWRSWSPRRWRRRATPARPSCSTSIRCPPSPIAEEAAKPGAPQLYDHIPNNVALDYHYGDAAKVEAAFASAAHVTKLDIVNTRVAVVAMEPRAALASYDKASERYTIQVPTQGVAGNRANLAKNILKVPNEKVHLLTRQCRRLVRHEEHQLSRICLHPACGQGAGPAGEMDRRALDQLPVRQPRPRADRSIASWRSTRRQIPRGQGLGLRQSRRLHHRRRAEPALAQRRQEPRQRLSHAADERRYQDRADQHHADGRLSRRRTPRGQLLHGAADRSRRRRNGHQPADAAQAQFHQAGADAVRGLLRRHLRQRRFPGRLQQGAGDFRSRQFCQAQEGKPQARQAARHRHRLLSRSHRASRCRTRQDRVRR